MVPLGCGLGSVHIIGDGVVLIICWEEREMMEVGGWRLEVGMGVGMGMAPATVMMMTIFGNSGNIVTMNDIIFDLCRTR